MKEGKKVASNKALANALLRFRVMAIWAGVMSLLLWFVQVPIHLFTHNANLQSHLVWIAIVHGYTYPFYVLTAFHYCLKAHKSFIETLLFILAGTLPVASFVAERRAINEYRAKNL